MGSGEGNHGLRRERLGTGRDGFSERRRHGGTSTQFDTLAGQKADLLRVAETIAEAANGLQLFGGRTQLLAQPAQMGVDRPDFDFGLSTPNGVEELFARKDASGLAAESGPRLPTCSASWAGRRWKTRSKRKPWGSPAQEVACALALGH